MLLKQIENLYDYHKQNLWSPFISTTEMHSSQTDSSTDEEMTLTNYKFLKTSKHFDKGLAKDTLYKITTQMACAFL